jgi:hypothetical protein
VLLYRYRFEVVGNSNNFLQENYNAFVRYDYNFFCEPDMTITDSYCLFTIHDCLQICASANTNKYFLYALFFQSACKGAPQYILVNTEVKVKIYKEPGEQAH